MPAISHGPETVACVGRIVRSSNDSWSLRVRCGQVLKLLRKLAQEAQNAKLAFLSVRTSIGLIKA